MSLLQELKRRNVLRVGAAYLAGAWLLIQLVNEILPLFGFSDAPGRIVVILLAIGFIPAVLIAWAYELTPTGIKRDLGGRHSLSREHGTTRNFDRAVIVVLALAVALFAVDRFVFDPARDAEELQIATERARAEARLESYGDKSVAVLPCADLSEAGDQEYFADGIAEELLTLLAKSPELRVPARTSAFSFKGKDATVAEIAATLNVAHVLECSVRRSGNRLRVTTQLIEAPTDTQLWSETYDREVGDVFAIQDDIAAKVVDGLEITLLGPKPTVAETSPEIFELYTLANYVNESRSSTVAQRLPEMRERLEQAVRDDPDYLPIRLTLARTYNRLLAIYVREESERQELLQAINETVRAIYENWPDDPDAITRYGYYLATVNGDLEAGAREVQRAHNLDPYNLSTLRAAAEIAEMLHRVTLAVDIQEYVLRRDPFCTQCRNTLIRLYLAAEQFDRAKAVYEDALGLDLELGDEGRLWYSLVLLATDEAEEGLSEFQQLPDPYRLIGSTVANHALQREDEFERGFAQIRGMLGENNPGLAQIYVWMNDLDSAVEIWDAQPSLSPAMFGDDLVRNRMSRHPRWPELATRAGILPDPFEHVAFDIEVPEI